MGTSKYIHQILTEIKWEIGNNTITVGDFNTPPTSLERSSRQKINKATEVLNDTIEQLDLINIYRMLYTKKAEYTLFPSAHGTFSRIDHTVTYKKSCKKFMSIEIISSIFSNNNGRKVEINNRKNKRKRTNMWRLKSILLKTNGYDEIKEEIRKYFDTNEN